MLSFKQSCSMFYIHSNTHPFRDQFYKEMFFFTLLLIEIEIKPHIKTSISLTCYSINSSNYWMYGCHGNCFTERDMANAAIFIWLLGNHLQYGVKFSEHL